MRNHTKLQWAVFVLAILLFSLLSFIATKMYLDNQHEKELAVKQSMIDKMERDHTETVRILQDSIKVKEDALASVNRQILPSKGTERIVYKDKPIYKPNCDIMVSEEIVSCIKHYVNGLKSPKGREIPQKAKEKLLGIMNDIDSIYSGTVTMLQKNQRSDLPEKSDVIEL